MKQYVSPRNYVRLTAMVLALIYFQASVALLSPVYADPNNPENLSNAQPATTLPVLDFNTTWKDPDTGEDVRVDFQYVNTDDPDQTSQALAWVQAANTTASKNGVDNRTLILTTGTPEEMAAIPAAEDLGTTAQQVDRVDIPITAWQRVGGWFRDQANSAKVAVKVSALQLADKYDTFLKFLTNNGVPDPIHPTTKKIPLFRASCALLRFVVADRVLTRAFVGMKNFGVPGMAIALSALLMSATSGGISLYPNKYMDWFNKNDGFASKWLVCGPLRFVWSKFLGKSPDEVAALETEFKASKTHKILNGALKFIATECVFIAEAILVYSLFGASFFPAVYSLHHAGAALTAMAHGGVAVGQVAELVKGFGISFLQVLWQVLLASSKSYGSQGLLDLGTSNMNEGKSAQLAQQQAAGQVSAEAVADKTRRIDFTSSMKLLTVSVLSNLGVVMSMSENPVAKFFGNIDVGALVAVGLPYYVYTLYRYYVPNAEVADGKGPWDFEKKYFLPLLKKITCSDLLNGSTVL